MHVHSVVAVLLITMRIKEEKIPTPGVAKHFAQPSNASVFFFFSPPFLPRPADCSHLPYFLFFLFVLILIPLLAEIAFNCTYRYIFIFPRCETHSPPRFFSLPLSEVLELLLYELSGGSYGCLRNRKLLRAPSTPGWRAPGFPRQREHLVHTRDCRWRGTTSSTRYPFSNSHTLRYSAWYIIAGANHKRY